MVSAYNIEYHTYIYSPTSMAYVSTINSVSYPFLMGLNLIFSALSLVLGLFDIFDKYISKTEAPEVGELGKE